MRKLLLLGMLAGVVLLCGMNGCCRLHKGIVLRGDWSIELNRVPHLAGHGPRYACTSGCVECPTCQHLNTTGHSPTTAEPLEQLPAPADPTALVPQRFLPVPTQPAFQPRHEGRYPQALPESTTSETITLPPPEAEDTLPSDAHMPLPPQPNELQFRPLAAGNAQHDIDRMPGRRSAAAVRTARQTAILPKGRSPMRPRSRP